MSAEIISMSEFRHQRTSLDQSERQAALRDHRKALVARVREAATDAGRKLGRDEELRPALYVGHLIRDLKGRKITQLAISQKLAAGGQNVKLERVSRQGTFVDEARKQKGSERLVRKVSIYVQVLDTLADMLDRHRDDVIFSAFKDTAFWSEVLKGLHQSEIRLSWLIEEMAQGVIRSERLDEFFNQARISPGRYDPVADDIVADDHRLLSLEAYEGGAALSWWLPPFPRFPVVRVPRHLFSGPLLVEEDVIAGPSSPAAHVARAVSPAQVSPRSFGRHRSVGAHLKLSSDVRLVVGPRAHKDDLGPMFELTSFVELMIDDKNRPLSFNLSLTPLGQREDDDDAEVNSYIGTVAALLDDGWHRVTGAGPGWKGIAQEAPGFGKSIDSGVLLDRLIGSEQGHEFPVYWEPIDSRTVAQLMGILSRIKMLDLWSLGPAYLLFPRDLEPPSSDRLEYFVVGGAEFENALRTGLLETTLIAQCRKLKDQLAARISERRESISAETAAMLARWRSLGR